MLSEIKQTEKDKSYGFAYIWNLKKNEQTKQNKDRLIETEIKLIVARGRVLGVWVKKVKGNIVNNMVINFPSDR